MRWMTWRAISSRLWGALGTLTDDGDGDAAAGDAFRRLSLMVHPDKHKGSYSGPANSAFRMLKAARDHFNMLAKRESDKRKKEEEQREGKWQRKRGGQSHREQGDEKHRD